MPTPTTTPAAAATPATPVQHRKRRRTSTDLALIAGFAALIAVSSVIAVPIGAAPITLQTFSVLLAGAVLGASRGFLAVLLYLAIGLVGLPVFAGGMAGLAPFAGPTVGYLLGMPFAAWLTGFIVERLPRRSAPVNTLLILVAAFLSNAVFVYSLGVLGLAWRTDLSLTAAFIFNLSFVPLDLVKIVLTAVVAAAVARAFPGLLPQPRPRPQPKPRQRRS
jgi:biotin transport system substrate-specific component